MSSPIKLLNDFTEAAYLPILFNKILHLPQTKSLYMRLIQLRVGRYKKENTDNPEGKDGSLQMKSVFLLLFCTFDRCWVH